MTAHDERLSLHVAQRLGAQSLQADYKYRACREGTVDGIPEKRARLSTIPVDNTVQKIMRLKCGCSKSLCFVRWSFGDQ